MIAKKEASESEDYQKNKKQKSVRRSENKRKRTTRKEAFQDGKVMIQCQYCPIDKRRRYQSYPALYTHVNIKHPGCKISSAKQKQKTDMYPVFKMMNILTKQYPENQQLERNLITIKNIACLLLAEQLLKKEEYCTLTYRDQDETLMANVKQQAVILAESINMDREMSNMVQHGRIFNFEMTKVFPISFGDGIARYFCKRIEFSSKLYVSLVILECFDQNLINEQERNNFSVLIWGQNLKSMNILSEYWQKWKKLIEKHPGFYDLAGKAKYQ